YALAVEKLLGIEVPKRCQYIRVIVGEMSRIMDHLVNIGTSAVDLGALTNFWYMFEYREYMYDLIERLTGHRLTNNYTRVGGVTADVDEDWVEGCRNVMERLPRAIDDVDGLLTRNRIFRERTEGVAVVDADDAVAWGFTGPCLRASGVDYDVRKVYPYSSYEDFDFDIPICKEGDTYARYLVRMEEMRQSRRIILQALDRLPAGPIRVADPRISLPPKEEVYNSIEGLMNHFKLIMEGVQAPAGEVYSYTEAGNGELGFYIVSKGGGAPYRIKIRPPCFAIYSSFGDVIRGAMIADAVATIGSYNIIAGELDR
ncbi:MAG: NADH-quinone oxidoreductase subunit D, partial [Myxococcales bacterium]|nr:NADH-quinone oxidoreductase subunit D [Myxococcales bacterium]